MASDAEVVDAAQSAAIEAILTRYDPEEIDDLDTTVTFVDGELTVDVYLLVEDEDTAGVVTEAVEAATHAVDELLEP